MFEKCFVKAECSVVWDFVYLALKECCLDHVLIKVKFYKDG